LAQVACYVAFCARWFGASQNISAFLFAMTLN
jgi:hypothetical protein